LYGEADVIDCKVTAVTLGQMIYRNHAKRRPPYFDAAARGLQLFLIQNQQKKGQGCIPSPFFNLFPNDYSRIL
jgi:hypothetical protein